MAEISINENNTTTDLTSSINDTNTSDFQSILKQNIPDIDDGILIIDTGADDLVESEESTLTNPDFVTVPNNSEEGWYNRESDVIDTLNQVGSAIKTATTKNLVSIADGVENTANTVINGTIDYVIGENVQEVNGKVAEITTATIEGLSKYLGDWENDPQKPLTDIAGAIFPTVADGVEGYYKADEIGQGSGYLTTAVVDATFTGLGALATTLIPFAGGMKVVNNTATDNGAANNKPLDVLQEERDVAQKAYTEENFQISYWQGKLEEKEATLLSPNNSLTNDEYDALAAEYNAEMIEFGNARDNLIYQGREYNIINDELKAVKLDNYRAGINTDNADNTTGESGVTIDELDYESLPNNGQAKADKRLENIKRMERENVLEEHSLENLEVFIKDNPHLSDASIKQLRDVQDRIQIWNTQGSSDLPVNYQRKLVAAEYQNNIPKADKNYEDSRQAMIASNDNVESLQLKLNNLQKNLKDKTGAEKDFIETDIANVQYNLQVAKNEEAIFSGTHNDNSILRNTTEDEYKDMKKRQNLGFDGSKELYNEALLLAGDKDPAKLANLIKNTPDLSEEAREFLKGYQNKLQAQMKPTTTEVLGTPSLSTNFVNLASNNGVRGVVVAGTVGVAGYFGYNAFKDESVEWQNSLNSEAGVANFDISDIPLFDPIAMPDISNNGADLTFLSDDFIDQPSNYNEWQNNNKKVESYIEDITSVNSSDYVSTSYSDLLIDPSKF